jgi:hypothetical protein
MLIPSGNWDQCPVRHQHSYDLAVSVSPKLQSQIVLISPEEILNLYGLLGISILFSLDLVASTTTRDHRKLH